MQSLGTPKDASRELQARGKLKSPRRVLSCPLPLKKKFITYDRLA